MTLARPDARPTAQQFPPGFRWGAATSSYQIEGAVDEDGRTPSIWDTFAERPGAITDGSSGAVAVDHYHRMPADVALMADLGLQAYRFSIAWPRIQPGGRGRPEPRGLDFYSRLVDELLARGITPWPVLYHWDLPQELEDAGGWPERDTAHRFAEYAGLVHDALGDRLPHWTTLNEPWCSAFLGYASGHHAPGRTDAGAAVRAAHHLLLGHGLALDALPGAETGITLNLYAVSPASSEPSDLDAARRVDGLQNRFFLDALLRGRYPDDVLADVEPVAGTDWLLDGDLAVIGRPIDFLGVNYYTRHVVTGRPAEPELPSPWAGSEHVGTVFRGLPRTDMDWEVDAGGFVEVLRRLGEEYAPPPIYITENGAAYPDVIDPDGRIRDTDRTAFIDAHLRAVLAALAAGVDIRGYFVWSLLDNFEWGHGYRPRFGIVHVDFATQERRLKESAHWYRRIIDAHAL